jgi:hypothetical protein
MSFAEQILDEAHEFNVVNMQVLEFDETLAAQEDKLREAVRWGTPEEALAEARTMRGLIIDLGYADDDELPTETAPEA